MLAYHSAATVKTDNAKISDWVWDQEITPSEKLLCFALLRFRNNSTGLCYPSHSTLAEWTGLSRSGIQKALRSLREKGLLSSHETPGRSNKYELGGAHSVSGGCSLSKHKPNSNQEADADLQDKSIRRVGGKDGLMWEN